MCFELPIVFNFPLFADISDPMPENPQPDSPEPPKLDSPEPDIQGPRSASFFAELKRRKVYRVAVAYAVVAWLIIQIASNTFSSFGIPDWVFRFVVIGLILCFPVAVILAWAFDITRDGVKLTSPVNGKATKAKGTSNKKSWLSVSLAAAAPTLIFGGLATYFYLGADDAADSGLGADKLYYIGSLAVLPIQVISGDDEDAAFAVGLHEELLTQLSGMDPLSVASRTSTLKYRDQSKGIREIGKELGVEYVVEGSLQLVGSQWRLTLQLIETNSDRHLQARSYDRDRQSDNVLLLQKQIAWEAAIDTYIHLKEENPPKGMRGERYGAAISEMKDELEELEVRFWADANRTLGEEALSKARKIIAASPDDSDIHVKYLTILGQLPHLFVSHEGWRAEMMLAIDHALRLSPEHFDTYVHSGGFYLIAEHRPNKALPLLQKGLKLYEENGDFSHNWPYYHLSSAMHLTGKSAAALEVLKRVPIEPEFGQMLYWEGPYELTRRFEEGMAFMRGQLDKAIEVGDAKAQLDIAYTIARFESYWSGSNQPIESFYENEIENLLLSHAFEAELLFILGDYAGYLREAALIDPSSDPYASNAGDSMINRAIALRESGNEQLAYSYMQNTIRGMESNPFIFELIPGTAYASIGVLNAMIGNEQAARDAIEKSEASLDPSRDLPLYYMANGILAFAYSELGEVEKACEKLDIMLSGPTGSCTGRLMLDFEDSELGRTPQFEAVIRKHVDQLRDPEILDTYFVE
ncbi:hypothetical protein VDG1235_912 [Verrucomicrobiia bacterium DG1235]|nr:hypothetical protein VDG1235_912 [Verrucomicrobiae bacterium DG1235]